MIKRFLYVEDGSVDIDRLEEELAEDTKVITYRQGANLPQVFELKEPAKDFLESEIAKLKNEIYKLREFLDTITKAKNHTITKGQIQKAKNKYLEDYYC